MLPLPSLAVTDGPLVSLADCSGFPAKAPLTGALG